MIDNNEQYKQACNQLAGLETQLKSTDPVSPVYLQVLTAIADLEDDLELWEESQGYRYDAG